MPKPSGASRPPEPEPHRHVPVLREEVVRFLARPGGTFIDATVGDGGHAAALLAASGTDSRLLGVDLDRDALQQATLFLRPFGERARLIHGSFAHLARLAGDQGFLGVTGILLDLGLRSGHLEAARGFSFRFASPLDMRFDASAAVQLPRPALPALRRLAERKPSYTAADILGRLPALDLAAVFSAYGDEPHDLRIAAAVAEARRHAPIVTTSDFVQVVIQALPQRARHGRIHAATRVFQALRVAVNRELETLARGLEAALDLLAPSGRLAVIAYHSGEDRIVKQRFRAARASGRFALLTRHPQVPSASELTSNPRSRSAKLRVLERLFLP